MLDFFESINNTWGFILKIPPCVFIWILNRLDSPKINFSTNRYWNCSWYWRQWLVFPQLGSVVPSLLFVVSIAVLCLQLPWKFCEVFWVHTSKWGNSKIKNPHNILQYVNVDWKKSKKKIQKAMLELVLRDPPVIEVFWVHTSMGIFRNPHTSVDWKNPKLFSDRDVWVAAGTTKCSRYRRKSFEKKNGLF